MDISDLTKKEVSEVMGKTMKTIDDWCNKGLPFEKKGRSYSFDLRQVIQWREENLAGMTHGVRKIDQGILEHKLDKEKEDARLKHEQANKVEMENAVRRGELIVTDSAEAWWSIQLVNMRNKIMSIPTKLTPRIIGEDDKSIVSEIIKEACIDALNELSDDIRSEGRTLIKEND